MRYNTDFDRGKRRRTTNDIYDFNNNPTICLVPLICMVFLIFVWSSLAGAAKTRPTILLADNGSAHATIIVASDATARVKKAARVLADYLFRSTGAKFIVTERPNLVASSQVLIFLIDKNSNFPNPSSGIPVREAFWIDFPNTRTIVLSGASDVGVEFGVYDFLERFLGVRWLFPGEIGTHVPRHERLEVQPRSIVEAPRFQMRFLSGLKTKDNLEWAAKNRMHNKTGIKFHHNLANLFPPEIYAKTHPEFFPIINGKRHIPKSGEKTRWQPCFSAPGLAAEAAKRIIDYFDENPDATSYSLGVNDSGGFCKCSKCLSKIASNMNYEKYSDYSALYYSWANIVAQKVAIKYPNKWFGCIAYREVATPPLYFKLYSKIIPFLTSDRLIWCDKYSEIDGKKNHELWEKSTSVIGWYDYLYGYRYLVPRIYNHKMADFLRYGADHGVKMIFAEAYPNWGEGPKLYLALKLLWNPELNPDSILDDWYITTVGKKAAPSLKQYFDFWENFWTSRISQTAWFNKKRIYLPFLLLDYVNEVTTQDIQYCRSLLQKVRSNAVTFEEKERANYFFEKFREYEVSIAKTQYKQNSHGP